MGDRIDLDGEYFWEVFEGWEEVEEENLIVRHRWQSLWSKVVKSPEGWFYRVFWFSGNTEDQDVDYDAYMVEVFPKEIKKTIYVEKGA